MQVAPIEKSKRADGRGHRKQGGERQAARDLGRTREELRRDRQINAMSDEAKEKARELGLGDHQEALLKAVVEPSFTFCSIIHFEPKCQKS